jgi:hypothetical protein
MTARTRLTQPRVVLLLASLSVLFLGESLLVCAGIWRVTQEA